MMSNTGQPQDQQPGETGTGTQGIFIQCEADRAKLQVLIGEVEHQLATQAATILLYGISPKLHHGFIVVEAARGIPREVVTWLNDHPAVLDYVIYDAPYDLLRFLREAADIGEPPKLPEPLIEQYVRLSGPVPLLGGKDARWIARAKGLEGMGFLIYEEGPNKIIFLNADESVDAMKFMGQESFDLLLHTHPELSKEHQATIEQFHALWKQYAQEEPTQAGEEAGL